MRQAIDFVNRALEHEDWAREKLALHAGRTLRIQVGPGSVLAAIDSSGAFVETAAAPDLTVTVPPLRLPELMGHPDRWNEWVTSDGDPALAATIAELVQTLPWFVERVLTRALGPILGTRVADAGRRLIEFPAYAGPRFAASAASYISEEGRMVVAAHELRSFSSNVSELAARVDALEQRIAAPKRASGSNSAR